MTGVSGQQVNRTEDSYGNRMGAPPPGGAGYSHGQGTPPPYGPVPSDNPLKLTFQLSVVGVAVMLVAGFIRGVMFLNGLDIDEESLLTMIEVFTSIGVALIAIGLLFGATMREELSDTLRTGMLVAMGILLGLWVSSGFVAFRYY
jgi:hypothetical protein